MKKVLVALLVLIVVAGLAYTAYYFQNNVKEEVNNDTDTDSGTTADTFKDPFTDYTSKTLEKDGVKMTYNYDGGNLWKYTIEAQRNTPCDTVLVKSSRSEGLPEKLTFEFSIQASEEKGECLRTDKSYKRSNEINASADAVFELIVKK